MADETNRIAEDIAAPGSAARSFHIGNTPQIVPPDLNEAEQQSLELQSRGIKVPTARPPFGVDDEGNPRPDPSLVPPEDPKAEARASRAGGASATPDKPPAPAPKDEPKR